MLPTRKTVLHIDDDPIFTRQVAAVLEKAGYESEMLHDPTQALEAQRVGMHRIVLLDIHMPGRSGLQVLAELKKHDAAIQVIMLTGLVNEKTIFESMNLGAQRCFFKPVQDYQPILNAIDEAWGVSEDWWRTMHELSKRRKECEEEVYAG